MVRKVCMGNEAIALGGIGSGGGIRSLKDKIVKANAELAAVKYQYKTN